MRCRLPRRTCRSWSSRTSPGSSRFSGAGSRLRDSWWTPRRRGHRRSAALAIGTTTSSCSTCFFRARRPVRAPRALAPRTGAARADPVRAGRPATKLRGFELGARDYLAKPFALDELVARVRAQLAASGVGDRRGSSPSRRLARARRSSSPRRGRRARRGSHRSRVPSPPPSRPPLRSDRQPRAAARSGLGLPLRPRLECRRRLHPAARKKLGAGAIETVRHAGYRVTAA